MPEVFCRTGKFDSRLDFPTLRSSHIGYAALDFLSAFHVDDGDFLAALKRPVETQQTSLRVHGFGHGLFFAGLAAALELHKNGHGDVNALAAASVTLWLRRAEVSGSRCAAGFFRAGILRLDRRCPVE